ncbi:MAG: dienelactone hydrolase family protein [Spirochaetales bacterium]|nr:dienelactone hydrolase family protein [Spirochaetales bacterium]
MKKVLLIASIVIIAGISCVTTNGDPADPGETNVTYKAEDGTDLKAYLVKPSGEGPFPAVIMIHEWWGLTRNITRMADVLSREGYAVLAVDAFRGKAVAKTPDEAMKLVQGTPMDQIQGDLLAAVSYLGKDKDIDAKRIASLGFCFGGTQSMYLGTKGLNLAAVVIFYGSGPITDPAKLGNMANNGGILGIYGEEDTNIPVKAVNDFKKALAEKKIPATITLYPGVGHAFVNTGTYQSGTAAEAWGQAVAFLDEKLKQPAM